MPCPSCPTRRYRLATREIRHAALAAFWCGSSARRPPRCQDALRRRHSFVMFLRRIREEKTGRNGSSRQHFVDSAMLPLFLAAMRMARILPMLALSFGDVTNGRYG